MTLIPCLWVNLQGKVRDFMAIRKREGKTGVSWQIDYLDPDGKRVRKSFKKKKDADAELGKRVSLMAEGRYLDVKKDYATTLGEALDKYAANHKHQATFEGLKSYCIENFRQYFKAETKMADIKYLDLESYQKHLMQKLTKHKKKRADATVNREIAVLHHVFSKAVSWQMIEQNPFDKGESLLLKLDNQRIRYLTEEEVIELIEECKSRKHLVRITKCALHTGMRRSEILTLKWSQIRNGFIYLEKTKTKNKREIPINDELQEVFKEIRREQGLTSQDIFLYHSKTIHRVERAFKGALRRANIEDFKFHDLRHTFASHLIMKGATLKEVMELLGHKDIKMTLRYAHLSEEHKKKAVNLLNGLTTPTKIDMSQNCHKSDSGNIVKS